MKTRNLIFVLLTAIIVTTPLFAQLKSPNNRADYIIIYPNEFKQSLKSFIEWRQAKGLKILACDLNDIYTEFKDSLTNQENIKDFLKYAYDNWQSPKPRYVLIAGGVNYIPTYRVKSDLNILGEDTISIEQYYVMKDESSAPNMMIGRIPARTQLELEEFLTKTMNFEDNFNSLNNIYDGTFFSDYKPDDGDYFETASNSIATKYLCGYRVKQISLNDSSKNYGTKDDYFSALNSGSTMVFNFVRSNSQLWCYKNSIYADEIASLQLTNKPFILSTIASTQSYDNPSKKGIIEEILMKGQSGAVATIAPSSIVFSYSSVNLIGNFFNNCIINREPTIGEAFFKSFKQEINSDYQRYCLLGDPALKNPFFGTASAIEPVDMSKVIIFPNPASDFIEISVGAGSEPALTGEIRIMNVFGQIVSLVRAGFEPAPTIQIDVSGLAPGMYFVRIGDKVSKFVKL